MGNFSRLRAENQIVFLNTGIIFGIDSISIQNNFGSSPIKYIGIGNRQINQSVNSSQYADLNISSSFIQEDFLIQQTGLQPFNCFIFQDVTNPYTCYSLISGYLNSYSAKYIANEVPQTQATMRFYNNAGNLQQSNLDLLASGQITNITTTSQPNFDGDVADTNYINLILNEGNINRVQDFSFSINFNRLPIYNIGSRAPKRIETIFPVSVTCDVTFEAADTFTDVELTDFPINKIQQTIELDVHSNRTNNILASYFFQNMTLVSNERSLNTEGNLTIVRKYIGQILNFVNASGQVPPNVLDFGFIIQSPSFFLDFGFTNTIATSGIDWGLI